MGEADRAATTFQAGFNCAQAVLSACSPDLGLDHELALKVAGAFGGGIARTGQLCGAVGGALMVIGLVHAQTQTGDKQAKETTYALAQEFIRRFEEKNGSAQCRELLGYDVGTPEGLQAIREKGLSASVCARLVADAIAILKEVV